MTTKTCDDLVTATAWSVGLDCLDSDIATGSHPRSAEGAQEASSRCTADEQVACCDPGEKVGCCGDPVSPICGCR